MRSTWRRNDSVAHVSLADSKAGPELCWWVMRAAALPRLEKLRNSLCRMPVCEPVHTCVLQEGGGVGGRQRVMEVSDEVSLAAAVCACAAAAHALACDFNGGWFRGLIWTESGLSWGQMSSLSPSAASCVATEQRRHPDYRENAAKSPRGPGLCLMGFLNSFSSDLDIRHMSSSLSGPFTGSLQINLQIDYNLYMF